MAALRSAARPAGSRVIDKEAALYKVISIDMVTLTRAQIATVFREWTRRAAGREPGWWEQPLGTLDDIAHARADRFIKLACLEATGTLPRALPRPPRPQPPEAPPRRSDRAGQTVAVLERARQARRGRDWRPPIDPETLAARRLDLARDLPDGALKLLARLAALGEHEALRPFASELAGNAVRLAELGLTTSDGDGFLSLTTAGRAIAEALGL